MPDLRPVPVLDGRQSLASPQIRLSPLPEGTILHVLAGRKAPDMIGRLLRLAGEAGLSLRTVAPGQWFLLGETALPHQEMRRLLAALEPHASCVDQSHGRARMRLEGPMVRAALAKGTAVDLDITTFPVGQSAATSIGHISTHLTCLDRNKFEIIVLRSFADALWADLGLMCAEFA